MQHLIGHSKAFVWIAAIFGLTACFGGADLSYEATDYRTQDVDYKSASFWCVGQLDLSGIGGPPVDPLGRETAAGYTKRYDPGTQPFPCWIRRHSMYQGLARFDLDIPLVQDLVASRGVETVYLRVRRRDGQMHPEEVRRQCTLKLRIALEPWAPGVFADQEDPIRARTLLNRSGDPITIDNQVGGVEAGIPVTDVVMDWIEGRQPNHGFVLEPVRRIRDDNDSRTCWGFWYDYRLEFTFAS